MGSERVRVCRNHYSNPMKIKYALHLCLALVIVSALPPRLAAQSPSADSSADRLKSKWTKPLQTAKNELDAANDPESAAVVAGILASLDQPGGLEPSALAADAARMKSLLRDLVRRGRLESAASLNNAVNFALKPPGAGIDGPVSNKPKSGGSPGPGGLVLYFPFNNAPASEGVVRDESGAGNDGRVSGATWVPDGKFGGAYRFSVANLDDKIVIPDNPSLNPGQVTVAAWIKSSLICGFWCRIMDKDYRRNYTMALGGDYNGKGFRGKLDFEHNGSFIVSGHPVNDGQWHHVAATYDGQTDALYVDGAEVKRTAAKRPGPLPGNRWDLCIGNSVVDYGTGEILGFDGLIDEVRIYNRALAAEEIKGLTSAPQTASATGAASTVQTSSTGADPHAEKLKVLKRAFEQGLLSKEQYDQKVKEVLDGI